MRNSSFFFSLQKLCNILTIITILLLISFSECGEDYYKLLGVKRNASKQEIRRAFKKLSLKYHPDKNKKDPERAKAMFIKIANAYEVLNDDKMRQIYDKYGEEGVKQSQQQENAGGGGFHFNFGGANFEDIFSQFFGGGGGRFHFNTGGQGREEEGPEKDFFENSDVNTLKMNNLSKLLSRRKTWFVYFFRSKDDNFKENVEKIKNIASQSYGIFEFGAINCKDDEEICDEYTVHSTPKLLYFPDSGNNEEEYEGKIEFQNIFKYGAKRMQNFVRVINKDNYADFLTTHSELYHVLLFTNKKSTPPLFKALSKDYLNKLSLGEVRQSETELVKSFNIQKFPTLLILIDHETGQSEVFDGEMKYDNIKKFFGKYAYKRKEENKTVKVRELNSNLYDRLGMCSTNDNKNICLIIFIDKEKPDNNEFKIIESIGNKYLEDHVKVFYLNVNKYKNIFKSFNEELNYENTGAVIVKGKRKKYINISKDNYNNKQDFYNIMENVLSGGGQFKQLKNGLIFSDNEENKSKSADL